MFGITETVRLVKGAKQSIIINFSKGDVFQLDTSDTVDFERILKQRFFEKEEVETEMFEFLKENILIYEIDSTSKSNFISRNEKYTSSYEIDFLIAEYDGLYDFELLIKICEQIRIPYLIIDSDLDFVKRLSEIIKKKSYPESITWVTLNSNILNQNEHFRIMIEKRGKGEFVSKDNITPSYLLYLESQEYNTYFNKKVFISSTGELKNTKENPEVYANINDHDFFEKINWIIKTKEFRKYWYVKKDDCNVCCNCEFRYSCVDNRIPVKKDENHWFFEKDCSYNPYTSKWE